METLTELIRWTTSLFAIAVAFAVASALKGAPVFRWAWRWLALVGLEALGTPAVDQRQVLEAGRQKLGAPNRTRLDDSSRAVLRGGAL